MSLLSWMRRVYSLSVLV